MDGERRAVLRGIVGVAGIAVGSGASSAAVESDGTGRVGRQVDARLRSGVTLFDLDGDGEYATTVERASEPIRDDDHPEPIRVTSGGRSTVDYAVSVAEPPTGTTLGGLDGLSYDYYVGADEEISGNTDGTTSGGADSEYLSGDPFLVVENDDGRHGASLDLGGAGSSGDRSGSTDEGWSTVDVLSPATGGTGERRWYEYTPVEDGYDGESFDDAVERFGEGARLALVGVGCGNAVTPTRLDAAFGNLVVDDETVRLPTAVANRVS
ncbi:hypothetical protein [Halorussus halobius]|uniref:hypothetical protein n=1 Tax=Halorussus halobius TaxID=1710537 RepID=UPI00109246D2|nr:hypothetical protein [Halorussus halobius]